MKGGREVIIQKPTNDVAGGVCISCRFEKLLAPAALAGLVSALLPRDGRLPGQRRPRKGSEGPFTPSSGHASPGSCPRPPPHRPGHGLHRGRGPRSAEQEPGTAAGAVPGPPWGRAGGCGGRGPSPAQGRGAGGAGPSLPGAVPRAAAPAGLQGSARPCRPRRGKMAAAAQALSGTGLLLAAAALALLAVAIGTDSWYETDARRHRERCRGFGHKRSDPPGSMSAPSSHLPLRARPPRALLPGRPPAPAPAAAASAALDSHCGRRFNSTVSGLWRRCHRAGYEPDSEELIRKGAGAGGGGGGPAAVRGAERGAAGAAGGAAAAAAGARPGRRAGADGARRSRGSRWPWRAESGERGPDPIPGPVRLPLC